MFLRLTRDQQNERITNQTQKSPNQFKTVSLSGVVLISTTWNSILSSFRMRDWTKRTPIELKFYTHLDKWVFKVSTNFELKQICKSISYQKIRIDLGFCLFDQNEFRSIHNQKLCKPEVLSCIRTFPNQTQRETPKQSPAQEIKDSSKIQRRRKETSAKTKSNKKLTKLSSQFDRPYELIWAPFLWIMGWRIQKHRWRVQSICESWAKLRNES
jgi:hypothetical protein